MELDDAQERISKVVQSSDQVVVCRGSSSVCTGSDARDGTLEHSFGGIGDGDRSGGFELVDGSVENMSDGRGADEPWVCLGCANTIVDVLRVSSDSVSWTAAGAVDGVQRLEGVDVCVRGGVNLLGRSWVDVISTEGAEKGSAVKTCAAGVEGFDQVSLAGGPETLDVGNHSAGSGIPSG